MSIALVVVVLMCATTGLALVAKRINVPFPVAFVLGGAALAFIPNLPPVHLDPNWIFLLVLPPLLFSGGWSTDYVEFKKNRRAIGLLAIGLVVFTTVIVAVVAHALLPALTWPLAFVLGVVPLAFSSGAGAAARRSMGSGVFGGMIIATFVATVFIPLFFVMTSRSRKRPGERDVPVFAEPTAPAASQGAEDHHLRRARCSAGDGRRDQAGAADSRRCAVPRAERGFFLAGRRAAQSRLARRRLV